MTQPSAYRAAVTSGFRCIASLPPRGAQLATLVVAACVAWVLVTRPIHDDINLYEYYSGFIALLLTAGYAIFLRSQSALLAVSPEGACLGNKLVGIAGARIEVRGWTTRLRQHGAVLWVASGADELRLGVVREPPPGLATATSERAVDAILTEADFETVLEALGRADVALAFRRTSTHDLREPRSRAGSLSVILPWLVTIVVVGAFGVGIGVFAPSLLQSRTGELLMATVVYGGVALGLVLTMTRRPSPRAHRPPENAPLQSGSSSIPYVVRPHSAEGRPTFLRLGLNVAAWQVASLAIGGIGLVLPIWLVESGFKYWVDVPGCEATCASRGLVFESYVSSKYTSLCTCVGAPPIHIRYNVFGGDSVLAAILDWLVRSVSFIGGVVGWLAVLIVLALRFGVFRRKQGERRTPPVPPESSS
jgi:hypothetical protein